MKLEKFTAFITEGLQAATVTLAENGADFEMRVRSVPDMIELSLRCARLGIRGVTLGAGPAGSTNEPKLIFTFVGAVGVEFEDSASALTPRERQVMELLVTGMPRRDIAAELELSTRTIDTYRSTTLRKLGLRNNADLARFAVRNGLVLA